MGLQLLGKTPECWACDMQPESWAVLINIKVMKNGHRGL
jgi:hypothetical protein